MEPEQKTFECCGRRFVARRNIRTGLVQLDPNECEVPRELSGAYVSFDAVRATLNCYFWPHGETA